MEQITRFFKFIKEPILFYTEESMLLKLQAIAGPNVEFVVNPFDSLSVFEKHPQDFWLRQAERDTEPYHTWQLGALWANKKYFLNEASKLYADEWFVWIDAGCVRNDNWEKFLIYFTKRNTFNEPGVYMQLLNPVLTKEYFKWPDQYIAGAIILMHRDFIVPYIDLYNITLDKYDAIKVPAISDQYIMASMNAPWIHKIRNPLRNAYPDEWFFFGGYI